MRITRSGWGAIALGGLLIAAIVAVYAPVTGHAFLDHEDGRTVVHNPHLRDALDLGWVAHAFLDVHPGHWTPVTWLSLRLDAAWFGMDSGAFLRTNLFLHASTSLLLFVVIGRVTRSWIAAVFVAMLYAVHPQRVESVAWVSARADVLGALFAMVAIAAHAALPRRGGTEVLVVVATALGLLAHPGLVVLPFGLLLLDLWPLARARGGRTWPSLVAEKLPLFGLVVAYALIASKARVAGGVDAPVGGWADRAGHASVAIARTLGDALWPADLSPFHPIGDEPGVVAVASSAVILVAVSIVAVLVLRTRPWITVGWAWFLLFLLPANGLTGGEIFARADRWATLPSIGLALAFVFTAREGTRGRWRSSAVVGGVVLCAVIGAQARAQVGHWSDTASLFRHALAVDPDNWFAHHRLAVVARARDDLATAEEHYLQALSRMPGYAQVQGELGDVYGALGRPEAAAALHANAERTGFDDAFADGRLGITLVRAGETAHALPLLDAALSREPESGDLHAAAALARARELDLDAARAHRDAALRRAPGTVDGLVLLAWLLATAPEGELRDARLARRTLEQIPDGDFFARPDALDAAAAALAQQRDFASAVRRASEAIARAEAIGWVRWAQDVRERRLGYLQGRAWYEDRRGPDDS